MQILNINTTVIFQYFKPVQVADTQELLKTR